MTEAPKNIHPAVARSLDTWHHMVASRDLSNLLSIVHPDAVFRSPMANTAYTSAPALMLALSTVIQVFEDFTYHRQLATDDGLSIVLEFSARVGDKQLKGIDLVRFNEEGQITEFEVMVRPLSGLQALGAKMGARLGDKLPAFKAKA
ncbi:nuclear transport factor 2 family protein [Acidovorax sp. A79]|uniref:nuclear transport factor 2 family protein n=1 Tax=Acidovorax sp. A79 TaxID=3056107 RepID=UPI0034E88CFA